jgi:hypothetical protein
MAFLLDLAERLFRSNLLFDAFSSREPVSTSLENALVGQKATP